MATIDWDDAFENAGHIPDGAAYPAMWAKDAAAFRAAHAPALATLSYGAALRERIDLFHPPHPPRGLAFFVHGGYWMRFDRTDWSHLAAGALGRGWSVAIAGYTLCPENTVTGIARQIAAALARAAGQVAGPIALAGHSAGGQLVTRLICGDLLEPELAARIHRVVSISGVHDLRPLRYTKRNEALKLTLEDARAESPALLEPKCKIPVTCWVGAAERPEFLRQNRLLAMMWQGLDMEVSAIEAPGRHHFDVIEPLAEPESGLMDAWLGPPG